MVGQQLGARLPEQAAKVGAAITFVVFGVLLIAERADLSGQPVGAIAVDSQRGFPSEFGVSIGEIIWAIAVGAVMARAIATSTVSWAVASVVSALSARECSILLWRASNASGRSVATARQS